MKLSDEDKLGLSPDEIKALEQAEEGEGENLLLVDGDPVVKPNGDAAAGADAEAATDAEAAAATVEGEELDEEDLDLLTEEDGASAREVIAPPPAFKVDERDFAAELKALRTERQAIEDKWAGGELDDAARSAQLAEIEDKRDALVRESTRAETLQEINQQNAENAKQAVLSAENTAIMALIDADTKATAAKLNYKEDVSAQKDFDAALHAVKVSATHAGKTPAEHVQAAHRMVLSMRGIAAPAPAPAAAATPAAAPAAKQRRDVPPSLGGLPDAGRAEGGVSDEAYAKFSTLKGEAAERYLAGLSEAEVERLTRMADAKMFS